MEKVKNKIQNVGSDDLGRADLLVRRRCRVCGEEKPLDKLVKRKSCKYGRDTFCKECQAAETKCWRNNNKDKVRKQRRDNYKKNIDKRRKMAKKYYKKYKERDWYKEKYKRWNDKQQRELTDNYVLKEITKNSDLKFNEIPKELIELKRVQILLYRAMYK